MNKNVFFATLFSLYWLSSTAQPTLTGSTTNPVTGDGFIIYNCDTTGISPGSSGSGVIWDYSVLSSIYKNDTTTYANCDSANFCSRFPNSNTVAHSTNFIYPSSYLPANVFYYYQANPDSLALRGDGLNNLGLFYKDPEIIFKYPFTYNTYFTDSFSNYDTVSFYKTGGSDTMFCDGYGSLKLPGNIYSNVLRIHKKQIIWDSIWGFQPNPIQTVITDNYSWYTPEFHNFLFSIAYNTETGSGTFSYTNVQYATGYIPSIVKTITENNSNLELYPNPAQDEVNVSFSTEANEAVSIILTDMMGREVAVIAKDTYPIGNAHTCLNTSGLPKGLYFVQLKSANATIIRKLQIL